MRFIVGVLLGYYMRGRKRLLIITLTVYIGLIIICSVVLPAIALSMLGLSVMRERASRPPQTSVPAVIGLNYTTAQIKLRDANLNIRVLAKRYDLSLEPGTIMAQTPQSGEHVDCGTVIRVTISEEDPGQVDSTLHPRSTKNQAR
jgi:beta-lactam-binding protein with PASTA domain